MIDLFDSQLLPGAKNIMIGDKCFGTISGRDFLHSVYGSREFSPIMKGWSVQMDILESLDELGVENICVIDLEKALVYDATLADFQINGVPQLHPEYGAQLCLPLSYWKSTPLKNYIEPHSP